MKFILFWFLKEILQFHYVILFIVFSSRVTNLVYLRNGTILFNYTVKMITL